MPSDPDISTGESGEEGTLQDKDPNGPDPEHVDVEVADSAEDSEDENAPPNAADSDMEAGEGTEILVRQEQENGGGDAEELADAGDEPSISAASEHEATSTATTTLADPLTFASSTASLVPGTTTGTGTDEQLDSATSTSVHATDTPTIASGRAITLANILNLVNTNLINSEGIIYFSNFFETISDTIDFRSAADGGGERCTLQACADTSVTVQIENDASIENALVVEAITGQNGVHGNDHASIETGDAYAGANIINIANTNLIDSNYLLVTLNAFEDVNGDIVFPAWSEFFEELTHSASTPESIEVNNHADVINDVDIDANTGDNSIDGADSSTIDTGDARSGTNVFNEINSTLGGGKSVSIIFRVHGDWAGDIFGAPSDLSWMEDGQGGIFLFNAPGSSGTPGVASVTGTSTARIRNDVNVIALTGENSISGAQTASISTGDANAGVNIINVANNTIIGRNWILAIVNIFGDFNGNLSFGRPDLWVGEQIETPERIENGSELTYTFSVINNGDSNASGVKLTDDQDTEHIAILDASVPYSTDESGRYVWELGSIPAGGGVEISYRARIQNAAEGTDITNIVQVRSHETDNNLDDNTDTATVRTDSHRSSGGRDDREEEAKEEFDPASEARVADAVDILRLAGSYDEIDLALGTEYRASDQKIRVINDHSYPLQNVVVHDILRDPKGLVIQHEVWKLGTVLVNEQIDIGYTVNFAPTADLGEYSLTTRVEGDGMELVESKNGNIRVFRSPDAPHASTYDAFSFHEEDVEAPAPLVAGSAALGIFDILPLVNVAYASKGFERSPTRDRLQFMLGVLLTFLIMFAVYQRLRQKEDRIYD